MTPVEGRAKETPEWSSEEGSSRGLSKEDSRGSSEEDSSRVE